MWKDYSLGCLRQDRASGVLVAVAAFMATLFLSLLCCLFYNAWTYDTERIVAQEGPWQARLTGALDERDIATLESRDNVASAELNEALSAPGKTVVDIRLHDARGIFRDLPLICESLGLGAEAVEYHLLLLSRYLIHDPADPQPPLLLSFYLAVLLLVSVSLILIIHNAFALSMDARIRQLGIFSSVGATPAQLRRCLVGEAAALCALPLLAGSLVGVLLSRGVISAVDLMAGDLPGRMEARFSYSLPVLLVTLAASVVTVGISAWLPARRLSRLSPLRAIRDPGELSLERAGAPTLLGRLFGIEGELAANALRAQRRALRTASLSLTLSFLGFTVMLCFFTLSDISTQYTYFERYQDAWDLMATVEDPEPGSELAAAIRGTPGVRDCVLYQKSSAELFIPAAWQSPQALALGGLPALTGVASAAGEDGFTVQAPLIAMDDESFLAYCAQCGVAPGTQGAVLLNRLWDSKNSSFRYREYIPFLDGAQDLLEPYGPKGSARLPLLGFSVEPPLLREEYADYALVLFLPRSLFESVSAAIGAEPGETYIRVLATEGVEAPALEDLERRLSRLTGPGALWENRLSERDSDRLMRTGAKLLLGALCVLLAVIGLANVFSVTLSFVRRRTRELARYMSLGMTPDGMKKMFALEALALAGRPVAVTLPLTALVLAFFLKASALDPGVFFARAPVLPVLLFLLAICAFVGLAYYLGGRRVLRLSLSQALRNEALF